MTSHAEDPPFITDDHGRTFSVSEVRSILNAWSQPPDDDRDMKLDVCARPGCGLNRLRHMSLNAYTDRLDHWFEDVPKIDDLATMVGEDGETYAIELKPGETGFDPETTSG